MERLLYVSKSDLTLQDADAVAIQIVSRAQSKSKHLGITGALIFTHEHFAQILEGTPSNIQKLMTSIASDPRHKDVVIVDKRPITRRLFPDWQMVYNGPSLFVSSHLAKLLDASVPSEQQRAAEWVTELAREFVSPCGLLNSQLGFSRYDRLSGADGLANN